jgi:competence ComEA-like helix-hairpin-helix protein
MKKKRFINFCLAVLLCVSLFPHTVQAEYSSVGNDTWARVLQVIDGDALKVQLNDTGEIALIRLAGLSSAGYSEAFTYTVTQLLGRDVLIKLDESIRNATIDGRWTPVYLYNQNVLYNRLLLQKGFARVDTIYVNITFYTTFQSDERLARSRSLGMWAPGALYYPSVSRPSYTLGYERVNINTATSSQLRNALEGLSVSSAQSIVSYRENAPYNRVRDVKFSGGINREQYEVFSRIMIICTNINTATEEELRMTGFTASESRTIIRQRENRPFADTEQLRTANIITSSKYQQLSPYLSIYEEDVLQHAIPLRTADINTADAAELNRVGSQSGITLAKARQIEEGRAHGYTYKSMGEIQKISSISLTDSQIHQLSDNLLVTPGYDILTVPAFININTATQQTLLETGFSATQASAIRNMRGRMRSGADIPIQLGSLDAYCTLYTNINVTSMFELLSLSEEMTAYFASALIDAAAYQPFGSMDEVSRFFADYDESSLYSRIRSYIILR